MGHTFYQYLAFIQPDSDASLEVLKTNLESFYAKTSNRAPQILLSANKITVAFDSYNFKIHLSGEPHVIEEAAEIADASVMDWSEKSFDKEKLKTATRRFEVSGEPDYDMDYFNDSLFIVEMIERFKGITVFNIG